MVYIGAKQFTRNTDRERHRCVQSGWHLFSSDVELMPNVMAHAQKPHFIFRLNGRVHLNRRGSVQSTADGRGVRISGSNAGYTTFQGRVRVLATHSIRQFPLHFPSHASLCATTFRTQYTSLLSLHAKFITVIIVCVHVCNCFVQFNILLTVHHALILGNCPT